MTLGLAFWILMLLVLVLGGIGGWRAKNWGEAGTSLAVWLLFLLLGWAVFGAPIRG